MGQIYEDSFKILFLLTHINDNFKFKQFISKW